MPPVSNPLFAAGADPGLSSADLKTEEELRTLVQHLLDKFTKLQFEFVPLPDELITLPVLSYAYCVNSEPPFTESVGAPCQPDPYYTKAGQRCRGQTKGGPVGQYCEACCTVCFASTISCQNALSCLITSPCTGCMACIRATHYNKKPRFRAWAQGQPYLLKLSGATRYVETMTRGDMVEQTVRESSQSAVADGVVVLTGSERHTLQRLVDVKSWTVSAKKDLANAVALGLAKQGFSFRMHASESQPTTPRGRTSREAESVLFLKELKGSRKWWTKEESEQFCF